TDPPVAAAAAASSVVPPAPTVAMAPWVGLADLAAAPLVISGTPGTLASYTISDGTKSVSGSGLIHRDGKADFAVDLSSLADGTLTATARLSISGLTSAAGTTTSVKDTSLPASVGLALPGFVGLLGHAAAPVVLTGEPGDYVEWT